VNFASGLAILPNWHAVTDNDRELAKEKKGDLNGAMADYNQAIITKHGANRIFDLLGALQA
jgi:hypothetical protein